MPRRSVTETLTASSERYRRRLLADRYLEIAAEVRALWPLADDPNPPAPRLTERLRILDAAAGHQSPAAVLSAAELLAIAERRAKK